MLFAGGFTFAVGVFAFARGLARSGVLSRGVTRLVVAAPVAMAVSRLPLAVVGFYLQSAAAAWPCSRWPT